jgi:hypothetical protein
MDVDMLACPGTKLIIVRPANVKVNDVSQLLLDLQTFLLVAVLLPLAQQKVLVFAVFPSSHVFTQFRDFNSIQRSSVFAFQ